MEGDSFGARLRSLRVAKKMTQVQLAEASGLPSGSIARLEQGGVQHPRWDQVLALSNGLGVCPGAFLGGKWCSKGWPR